MTIPENMRELIHEIKGMESAVLRRLKEGKGDPFEQA